MTPESVSSTVQSCAGTAPSPCLYHAHVFERWEMEMAVPYAKISLAKYMGGVLLAMHWAGCAWGLVATTQEVDDDDAPAAHTWIAALEGGKSFCAPPAGAGPDAPCVPRAAMVFSTPWRKYLAALYFACYTLTSVGYGDIAPQTHDEYVVCTLIISLGALVWACESRLGLSRALARSLSRRSRARSLGALSARP